jgi:rhamnosyltransferase
MPFVLPSVSVVIPVLNAAPYLRGIVTALASQKPAPPAELILVDSRSTDATVALAGELWPGVKVVPIDDFSHGRSRNLGARAATGEVVVLMTQDAVPADEHWLAELLAPFADQGVAAAYSRQVPRPEASPMERFFLACRFPDGPEIRREKRPGGELTLEDVFFSNVSAAVRRADLLAHPFDETLIMSEDQQLSRDLLAAGRAVVYRPSSVAVHSHDYTLGVVFRRYFDSVYSLTVIFPRHGMGTSASMGLSYLAREAGFILRRHPAWTPYYFLYTFMKTAGTIAGHFAEVMPRWLLRRLSLHDYHWHRSGRE